LHLYVSKWYNYAVLWNVIDIKFGGTEKCTDVRIAEKDLRVIYVPFAADPYRKKN
jgi:hypothetical protein